MKCRVEYSISRSLALKCYKLRSCQICFLNSPTHNRPMMRQPATEAWTTGIVSDNSASNTLKQTKFQI